jgi:hypothetical protein
MSLDYATTCASDLPVAPEVPSDDANRQTREILAQRYRNADAARVSTRPQRIRSAKVAAVRRRGGMANLSVLVSRVYPGQSRDELEAVRAFGAFMRALSPRVLRNARPVQWTRGTLIVHTSNSAWANTLSLEADGLLAKVKRAAPEARIRKLVFRAGRLPEAALPLAYAPLVPELGVPLRELPEDIARELARIQHDGLRDAVTRAASIGLATRDKRDSSNYSVREFEDTP